MVTDSFSRRTAFNYLKNNVEWLVSILSIYSQPLCENNFNVNISDQSAVGGGFFNSGNQFGNANTPNQPQKTVSLNFS